MPKMNDTPAIILDQAITAWKLGINPDLIELPEKSVFPGLIRCSPSTARKSRVTGTLLGRKAPRFVRHGRSIRYRLSDIFNWINAGSTYKSTADAALSNHGVITNAE